MSLVQEDNIGGMMSVSGTITGVITVSTGGGGSDTLGQAMSETGLSEYEFDDTVIHPVVVKKVTAPNATTIADLSFSNSSIEEIEAEKVYYVGESAFDGAQHIKKLTLGKLTAIGKYAFRDMGYIGNDIELHIDISDIQQNDLTFRSAKLKNLTVDSLATISGYVFYGLKAAGTISFPDATVLENNGLYEASCNTLLLPKVTSLPYRSLYRLKVNSNTLTLPLVTETFNESCKELDCTTLILPSITSIGKNSFSSAKVTDLYLSGNTMCVLGDTVQNCFSNCPIYTSADARVHVPASLESTYKADSKWSDIASKIVGDL